MGFIRAAFVRVFFGVFNTLSVIARRALHAVTTVASRFKNALMQDLIPACDADSFDC